MVNNSGTHPDWSHRLFVLVEFNAEAGTWSPVSKWFLLPEGIVVDSAGSTFGDSAVAMDRSPGDLQYAGRTFAPSDYSYQIFLPGGHMATSSVEPISPNLRVIEKPILPSGGPSGNYYNITLNLMTSIPIVSRP
jgi:hypothetical protein